MSEVIGEARSRSNGNCCVTTSFVRSSHQKLMFETPSSKTRLVSFRVSDEWTETRAQTKKKNWEHLMNSMPSQLCPGCITANVEFLPKVLKIWTERCWSIWTNRCHWLRFVVGRTNNESTDVDFLKDESDSSYLRAFVSLNLRYRSMILP